MSNISENYFEFLCPVSITSNCTALAMDPQLQALLSKRKSSSKKAPLLTPPPLPKLSLSLPPQIKPLSRRLLPHSLCSTHLSNGGGVETQRSDSPRSNENAPPKKAQRLQERQTRGGRKFPMTAIESGFFKWPGVSFVHARKLQPSYRQQVKNAARYPDPNPEPIEQADDWCPANLLRFALTNRSQITE
jgi:hypothetical protein